MKLAVALFVVYAGLLPSKANASPLTLTTTIVDNGWEKVRMHCDQFGRCWRERWRNPLLESYNFARPPRPPQTAEQQTGTNMAAGKVPRVSRVTSR